MIIKKVSHFENQLTKIQKKYLHAKSDIAEELVNFNKSKNISLGHSIFKLRVKNSDIPCGKSGGYRVIVFYEETKSILIPFIVYSKRDKESLSKNEIEKSLKKVLEEIKTNKY